MKKMLCMILTIIIAFGVAGCVAEAKPVQAMPPEAKPEEAVIGYFEAAKQFDLVAMNKFVNPENVEDTTFSTSNEDEKVFLDYLKENAKKVTYEIKGSEIKSREIKDSQIKDDTAIVTVNCKFVDGQKLFDEALYEYVEKSTADASNVSEPTEEEATKEIVKIILEKQKTISETFIQKTLKIECVKIGSKWYIDEEGHDIENVFASNFLTDSEEMSKSMDGEDSEEESPEAGFTEFDKLLEIYDFTAYKIWNEGFNSIQNYNVDGKTQDGETIDIDSTLSQLEETMDKMEEYNSYINGLSDPKYDKAKTAWSKVYVESTLLYAKVKLKKPVKNAKSSDIINNDLLSDALDDFTGALDKILE